MRVENIQYKRFAAVGTCIYCGSDGAHDGLGDEHIIPLCLDGGAVLPEASCSNCAKITSYLEGYLGRSVYYHFRLAAGIQSRRRKKHPTSLEIAVTYSDRVSRIELSIADHPFVLSLLAFEPPAILQGLPPATGWRSLKLCQWWHAPADLADKLNLETGQSAKIPFQSNFNAVTFARSLAKIAHATAVARFGLSGFKAFLPELILGRYPYAPYLVGGEGIADPPPPSQNSRVLHETQIQGFIVDGKELLVARLRLFANVGTPERGMPNYRVVVGESLVRPPRVVV